jgi:catechol 2,3-dioxygenase-like lactoylglutathione lyase family enzyme
MSRVQLALNVSNIDEAVAFYAKFLGVEPAKRRPGYANFVVTEPPLKLVLIEGHGEAGALNHLGIEVETTTEVGEAVSRLSTAGVSTTPEGKVSCCYARQDKTWVNAPDGLSWEIYTVLGDASMLEAHELCCSDAPDSAARCC